MKRGRKVAWSIAGCVGALAGLAWLWSFSYASAYYYLMHTPAIYQAFLAGDVLLPMRQASAYWHDPRVHKLVVLATAAAAIEGVVLGGLVYLFIKRPWVVRPPEEGSRIATAEDLAAAELMNGRPGKSVLLGTFNKKQVRYSGDSHFFVNGPSRAGKGRGFVMTNLLEWEGSAIVLDVKKENFNLTGAARMALGQKVFLFAPGSEVSHRWNPLTFVREWPSRATDLSNLAASLIVLGEKEEPYWKETARGLFAGVLGYVLESRTMEGRRHLRSALRMFSTGTSFSAVLNRILKEEPELNPFITNAFMQHLGRDEEQRPSFEGHITTSLKAWNNLLMASATAGSDFDIRKLRSEPFSLFIAAPVSDFGTVEPIIRLLIQQIHDIMLRELPDKKTEPHKALLMLDEFYQFQRLPEIIQRAPLVAGYGLTIALVAQNIPQIDERYGIKTRDALLGNMDIQLYIGVGDETTAKLVSENMGKHWVEREGWGKAQGISFGKTSSGGRFEPMPLMTPDGVRRLNQEKTILQIRGSYTAVLDKLNFYTQALFLDRRREVDAMKFELPDPLVAQIAEWPLFEPAPAGTVGSPADFAGVREEEAAETDQSTGKLPPGIVGAAHQLFVKPDRFLRSVQQSLDAIDDDKVTAILRQLRERPATLGALRADDRSARQGLLKRAGNRTSAEVAAGLLREAIIAERRGIIADRARRFAGSEAELQMLRTAVAGGAVAQAIQGEGARSAEAVPSPTASLSDLATTLDRLEATSVPEDDMFGGAAISLAEPAIVGFEVATEDEDEFDISAVVASLDDLASVERLAAQDSGDGDEQRKERLIAALAGVRETLARSTSDNPEFATFIGMAA